MKTAICLGGTGFIAHHMARRLKSEGYWVRCVDIKRYEYGEVDFADEVVLADLRDYHNVEASLRLQGVYSLHAKPFEEIRQFDLVFAFCCNMGGAGYVFTGDNDAEIISDSALMNINIAKALTEQGFKGRLFYSSSACIYPQQIQEHSNNPGLKESDARPYNPDSVYGLEKIFSENLYACYAKNHGLDVRVARFHNIYGPEGTYTEPKAKAPAAMCRKVIEAKNMVEVWGSGNQTRSFLYIDDCIDAVRLLMQSDFKEPINIGSEEMISINGLAEMAIDISGKKLVINNVKGPVGVMGRNSNNDLIREKLGWEPKYTLREGMERTFSWINQQINGI
jgi:GDP-D-mannose 3',5'-epimerase